jgi:Asp-tRNA(Asn)/Glu-tRNA(Gln) amidotransferase A subunit family amidase
MQTGASRRKRIPRTMELRGGLMITGRHFEDATVLHAAHAYKQTEDGTGWP